MTYDEMIDQQLERKLFKCVCAWCEAVLREAAPGWEKDGVTSTICPDCKPILLKQREREEVSA